MYMCLIFFHSLLLPTEHNNRVWLGLTPTFYASPQPTLSCLLGVSHKHSLSLCCHVSYTLVDICYLLPGASVFPFALQKALRNEAMRWEQRWDPHPFSSVLSHASSKRPAHDPSLVHVTQTLPSKSLESGSPVAPWLTSGGAPRFFIFLSSHLGSKFLPPSVPSPPADLLVPFITLAHILGKYQYYFRFFLLCFLTLMNIQKLYF